MKQYKINAFKGYEKFMKKIKEAKKLLEENGYAVGMQME